MAKWIYAVETNCGDSAREAEFHEWYDKMHIPDVLETPDFIRATRYETIEPDKAEAKYLAIYEIESQDIDETMKRHRSNIEKKLAQGRRTDLLVVVRKAMYKQIGAQSR